MYQFKSGEIATAIRQIVCTDVQNDSDEYLMVTSKDAAETISELFIQDGKGGSITGPYLQPIKSQPTRIWFISK